MTSGDVCINLALHIGVCKRASQTMQTTKVYGWKPNKLEYYPSDMHICTSLSKMQIAFSRWEEQQLKLSEASNQEFILSKSLQAIFFFFFTINQYMRKKVTDQCSMESSLHFYPKVQTRLYYNVHPDFTNLLKYKFSLFLKFNTWA